MSSSALRRTLILMAAGLALPSPAVAQVTGHPTRITTPSSPFRETSAGRAMRRISFGDFDASPGFFEVFRNGSYENVRSQFCTDPRLCPADDTSSFLLNRIITQSQTFPNASSASGFTFTWREGAAPVLESEIFGPLYGERGLTNGRNQLSVTLNYQHLAWESLNDSPLRNDQAGFDWGDFNYSGQGGSYVGRCRMNITSDMAILGLNYGLTPRLDVRVVVPFVSTSVEGSNEFIDFAVDSVNRVTQVGEETGFTPQGRYYVTGESTGIGDIDVGLKYAVLRSGTNSMALAATVRLGTGSFDKMTGTGETSGYVAMVSSFEFKGISPSFEVGYLLAGSGLYDEIDTKVGLSFRVIRNRLTLTGEYVGRRVFNVRDIFPGTVLRAGVRVPESQESYDLRQFEAFRRDVALFFVAGGAKVRLAGQLLGTGYVLFPLGSQGLQAQSPAWSVGLNYAF